MARASIVKLCTVVALIFSANVPAHALITFKQPSWKELSSEQKVILAPLVNEWDAMESLRKKKWLGIAQRYSGMTPEEKLRIQARMKEWASLSPEQRKSARDSYAAIQKAPDEYRNDMKETIKQQWQQYMELPESEKEKLRQESRNTPPAATSNSRR